MGKSNKFDYTNRSNSGAKLGQIIGSALQKEAEKVQKDAERHLQKARKQSYESTSSTSDAPSTTHVIDLKTPGKNLGDDGVCALLDGLEFALRSGTRQVSLVLIELDLSGNCITTASLARLAPVIQLAWHDLKTLNLSGNNIKVQTTKEASQWSTFLLAFRGCRRLRTLHLSGNPELGRRALEILARVHTAEQHSPDLSSLDRITASTSVSDNDEDDLDPRREDTNEHDANPNSSMDDETTTHGIHGLRSIPYITLHNVGLDDAGAMWLSYVLQDHFYPSQLFDESTATPSDPSIKTVPQEIMGLGVEWAENKALGKEGSQLLEKVDILRRQVLLDDDAKSKRPEGGDIDSVIRNYEDKRKSIDDKLLKLPQEYRRASIKSIRTSDSGEHEVYELESARKKINRAIIAHDGASTVELWHAALNFVRTSRILLYLAPTTREIYGGPPLFKRADAIVSPTRPAGSSAISVFGSSLKGLSVDTPRMNAQMRQIPYIPQLSLENGRAGPSNQRLRNITNAASKATVPRGTNHRKGAFGEGNDLQTVNDKLNRLQIRNEDPLRFVRYQEKRIADASRDGRHFRDETISCDLPVEIVEHITTFLATGSEKSVMNERQKMAAIRWGQTRETLMTEREWLRKDESAQVLMLLDSIDCLAYS